MMTMVIMWFFMTLMVDDDAMMTMIR